MLTLGRVDLDVDPVRAGPAREAREAAADHVHERDEMGRVADVRREEAVERVRQPPEDDRDDPDERRDDEHHERPQHDPDEVGNREEEAEEHGEPWPPEVVGDDRAHRVFHQVGVRLGERGVGRRVARREQQEIAGRLSAVAEGESDEVTQAARRSSASDDEEPGEEGAGCGSPTERGRAPPDRLPVPVRRRPRALARRAGREAAAERGCDRERRKRQKETEEATPPPLLHGRVDRDVHGIVGLAAEPRVRVRRKEDVGAHLRRIPDVVRDELVQARRDLALDEHGEPVHERDDERRDPPQRHPDDERDRQEEPEDDREPSSLQVVADDEPNRSSRWRSPRRHSCPKSRHAAYVVPRTIARWSSAATSSARRR